MLHSKQNTSVYYQAILHTERAKFAIQALYLKILGSQMSLGYKKKITNVIV